MNELYESILESIRNGNWSQAALMMVDGYVRPAELVDYIDDCRFEEGPDRYEWFTLGHAVSITEMYHQAVSEQLAA